MPRNDEVGKPSYQPIKTGGVWLIISELYYNKVTELNLSGVEILLHHSKGYIVLLTLSNMDEGGGE